MNTKVENAAAEIQSGVEFDRNKLEKVYLNQMADSRSKTILFISGVMPLLILGLTDIEDAAVKSKTQLFLQHINEMGSAICDQKVLDKKTILEYLDFSRDALLCFLEIAPVLKGHSATFAVECPEPLYSRALATAETLVYSAALLEIAYTTIFGCSGCPVCEPDSDEIGSESIPPKGNSTSDRILH